MAIQEDAKKRFSNRACYYAKYRPRYPDSMLSFMENELGLSSESVVADIGSGTGILTELFLKHGYAVFGVEPNVEMRKTAEELLRQYPKFTSIEGTAEVTTLQRKSVDLVTAAQAFHWFDPVKTREEFTRIVKPHGWVLLIWNTRRNSPGLMEEYERLVGEYANKQHFRRTAKERVGDQALSSFLGGYKLKTFSNSQVLDFDGLTGRLLSSSYVPLRGDIGYAQMIEGLRKLFDSYQEDGVIRLVYDTEVYYSQLMA